MTLLLHILQREVFGQDSARAATLMNLIWFSRYAALIAAAGVVVWVAVRVYRREGLRLPGALLCLLIAYAGAVHFISWSTCACAELSAHNMIVGLLIVINAVVSLPLVLFVVSKASRPRIQSQELIEGEAK